MKRWLRRNGDYDGLINTHSYPLHQLLDLSTVPGLPLTVFLDEPLAGHLDKRWWQSIKVKQIRDQKLLLVVKAAMNEELPFAWFYSDRFIFGRHEWELKKSEEHLGFDELRLVFLEEIDKERRKFERLQHRFSGVASTSTARTRNTIPQDVRIFVWRRDQGRCVICGSQEKLEYDHIIPFSKGGSNTERNIQLLCERCNRQKSDGI